MTITIEFDGTIHIRTPIGAFKIHVDDERLKGTVFRQECLETLASGGERIRVEGDGSVG